MSETAYTGVSSMIDTAHFTHWLRTLLAEIFGVSLSPDAFILESGHSGLMGTINAISAETASVALTPQEPTIASQCGHILFLLSFFDAYEQGQTPAPDWEGSWSARVVDEAAWAALRGDLQTTYDRVIARLTPDSPWPDVRVDSLILLLGHCAYHVGQVRQLLTAVRAK